MKRAILVVVAGCGRVAFDPTVDSASAPTVSICGASATAPDPLAIAGTAFRYTSYTNDRASVQNATITALTPAGAQLAQASGANDGTYTLALPTGGAATAAILEYTNPSVFTTRVVPDTALDRTVPAPPGTELFALGDGPMWNSGQMTSIYMQAGCASVDSATASTLNISVVDCAGAAIAGAQIAIEPPPPHFVYLATTGIPDPAAAATTAPYAVGLACNIPPGPTTITATAAGYTFAPQTIELAAGQINTLALVRPLAP